MFILVPLKPTFFTKQRRSILLNLQDINKIYVKNKKITFYPHPHNLLFSPSPTTIHLKTEEKTEEVLNSIQQHLRNEEIKKSQERIDMPSPDALAMAALEDYENENKNQKQLH